MRLAGVALRDRYVLRRRLGRGGMGEVWLGLDSELGREVAVKVMLALPGDGSVRRFRREADTLAGLQHPGITVVHDAGRHEPYHFIVMELLRGHDLAHVLAGHPGGLPHLRVLDLTRQTVDALAAAHRHGIVHRDVKPANLFVQAGDRVKVCDFGIARNAEASGTVTATGLVIGTPAYMSPEQWEGKETDARTDLYALGVVMFELLTGQPPFPAAQPFYALMRQHVEQAPPRPGTLRPGIPRDLEEVVMALLAKDPRRRPDSRTLAAALAAPTAPHAAPTVTAERPAPAPETRRDHGPPSPPPTAASTWAEPGPTAPTYVLRRTLKVKPHRGVSGMTFSPDGRVLAVGDREGGVRLWDPHTGTRLRRLTGPVGWVRAVVFSPDGSTLATAGGGDKVVRCWDPHTGTLRRQLTGHTGWVRSVAFSPDSRTIATGDTDGSLHIWDAHTGGKRFTLGDPVGSVLALAFSPDGSTLAAGGYRGVARVERTRSGNRSRRLGGVTSSVAAVAFSPDGRSLAAGGADASVHVWDARTGGRHHRFTGYTAPLAHLAFSPDGHLLMAGDTHANLHIRNARTGKQLLILPGQPELEHMGRMALTPDGRLLAVGFRDRVQLWSVHVRAL